MKMVEKLRAQPGLKEGDLRLLGYFFGSVVGVFAACQLADIQGFATILVDVIGINSTFAMIKAVAVVVLELLAVVWLFALPLGKIMRQVGRVAAWVVSAFWVCLSVITTLDPYAVTVGFLGGVVQVPPGYWAIAMSLAFVVLVIWMTRQSYSLPKK